MGPSVTRSTGRNETHEHYVWTRLVVGLFLIAFGRELALPVFARSRCREWASQVSEVEMMSSWWVWWMIVMFFLLVTPVGYGWGYRGWGPPYPSYFQRQRDLQASSAGASGAFNHYSWGWGGDFVWLILFVGIFWVATAMWWPVWR